MCLCQSQSFSSSHPPLSPLVSVHLISASVSLFLLCKQNPLYQSSGFHIYASMWDVCFSLSHLFHSLWPSMGSSMSLQMTQFHFFLWLSNIPPCVCTTSSLSIPRFSLGIRPGVGWSFSNCSLLVCRNTVGFWTLTLYPEVWLRSFMSPECVWVSVSVCTCMCIH